MTKKKTARESDAQGAQNAQASEMTYEITHVPPRAIAGYRRSAEELADAATTETLPAPDKES